MFVAQSAERDLEYLGDQIVAEALNVLARLPDLRVADRNSSCAFNENRNSVQETGQEFSLAANPERSVR